MFIILVAFYYSSNKKSLSFSTHHIFIFFVGLISSIAMSFSPSYHSGTNLFLFFCTIILALSTIDISLLSKNLARINIIISIALFSFLYQKHHFINEYFHDVEKVILSEKAKGQDDIIVKNINIKTNRLVHYFAIENNSQRARNIHISNYYGIKSIKSINQNN